MRRCRCCLSWTFNTSTTLTRQLTEWPPLYAVAMRCHCKIRLGPVVINIHGQNSRRTPFCMGDSIYPMSRTHARPSGPASGPRLHQTRSRRQSWPNLTSKVNKGTLLCKIQCHCRKKEKPPTHVLVCSVSLAPCRLECDSRHQRRGRTQLSDGQCLATTQSGLSTPNLY